MGNNPPEPQTKRLFGIIPNYRTAPTLAEYKPLTVAEKWKLASQDSLDRGTVILAAFFAGLGQLNNSNRSFGQGASGYASYFGTSYADYFIGDYMTEAVYPTLLHQDPRYFRKSTGTKRSRLLYAIGQSFLTHGDDGSTQPNYSELLGNATATAIGNAYYKDNRTVSDNVSKWGTQIAVDMAANILKEFYPEIASKFSRKPKGNADRP